MRLLGITDLAAVDARGVGEVLGAVETGHLIPGRRHSRLRERRRIGPHVGDVAVLVEALGHLHRALRGVAQLAPRLLLQCRGAERGVRRAAIRLAFDGAHRERRVGQARHEFLGTAPVEEHHVVAPENSDLVEVLPRSDPGSIDGNQRCRESAGIGGEEGSLEIPVRSRAEPHALPLPLDEDPHCRALHPSRREAGADHLPQHRRHFVPEEPIEDATRLLGIDQTPVEVAGFGEGVPDGFRGDLVKHHPPHRHLRVEHLEEVPGDRFPLPVLIGGEIQLTGFLEETAQFADLLLLLAGDDVEGLEAVVHVDAEPGPLLLLVGLGDVVGPARQVADVTDR
jgi:hypothetical protein